MRFRVTDRMLAALSGLVIIALGLAIGLFGAGLFPNLDWSFLRGSFPIWQRAIIIAVAVLLFLLGIHGLWMLFRRRADKGFIMQRTDMGDMSIAMTALKSMVKKCVDQHQEVSVKKIHIHRLRSGIIVDLKLLLANGINIPLTVNVLQKQIKQYITSCSGVDVHEVRVQVDTSSNMSIEEKKEEIPVLEQEAAPAALLQGEPMVETAAESILRHTEEPADYVETVVTETYEAVAAEEVPTEAEAVLTEAVEEIPAAEYVEEAATFVEDVPAEAAQAVEEYAQEVQTVAEEAQEVLEETAENAEGDLWVQEGDAFVRQDEETAE